MIRTVGYPDMGVGRGKPSCSINHSVNLIGGVTESLEDYQAIAVCDTSPIKTIIVHPYLSCCRVVNGDRCAFHREAIKIDNCDVELEEISLRAHCHIYTILITLRCVSRDHPAISLITRGAIG